MDDVLAEALSEPRVMLAKRMRDLMARFRAAYPLTALPAKGGCYLVPSCSAGQPFALPLVWYPSTACRWSELGGCTMCNFGAGPSNVSSDVLLAEMDEILERLDPGVQSIFFAPGGSFFNDREIGQEDRVDLARKLGQFPFLRMVGVETRPSYVTRRRVEQIVGQLPASVRYFLIGMGLESSSPLVREVCVNKGNDLPAIERAINTVRSIGSIGHVRLGFELYVLLKPPFLSEAEAIDDAVRSIEWATAQGADTIGLFMTVIKDRTLCHWLAEQADFVEPLRYQPPWWHSAFEVLRRLTPETAARVQILGPTSEIAPLQGPRACSLCSDILSGTVTAWNYFRDQKLISSIDIFQCECKAEWRRERSVNYRPLSSRLQDDFEHIEARFLSKAFLERSAAT